MSVAKSGNDRAATMPAPDFTSFNPGYARSLLDLFEKGSAVPPPIPVILAAYDPEWPRLAAGHSRRLQAALGSALVIVHHIGSTSVPGLAAKPIIDLMPVVSDLAELDRLRGRIEALGYGWHGELGITGRRYCTLDDQAGVRAVQLHIFQASSPHAERHIALRDYLRAHPEIARAYENEKRRAQSLYPDDSHRYGDEKAAWIRDAEVKAFSWYAQQRSGVISN
jgi:GrpB-like predicted nucleotidyltransferase (UPF0157 family)